jgi:hypothetical protein
VNFADTPVFIGLVPEQALDQDDEVAVAVPSPLGAINSKTAARYDFIAYSAIVKMATKSLFMN